MPNAIEKLHDSDVHVWLGFPPADQDAALLDAYGRLLSPEERLRHARFKFPGDQWSFLFAHALLRSVLSKYLAVDPGAWHFSTGEHGRPEIADATASMGALSFNLSHTQGLAVVAVTRAAPVGVDAEQRRARPAPTELTSSHFAPQEVLDLHAVPEHRRSDRFYEYWTLKEAYVKARGLGLSAALDQFCFQFEGERSVRLSVEPGQRDNADSWKLWQFLPSADHVVAVCARRAAPERQRLVCRRCIPLDGDEELVPIAVRESV
jgi:4'-phosphopantetheinyl transferase